MTETGVSDGERLSNETGRVLDGVWEQWGRVDPEMAAERYHSRFIPEEIWRNMGVQELEAPSVEYPSYRAVRRQYGVLMTTYGLSFPDLWSDENHTNGVGVEIYAAATGIPADAPTNELATGTWLGHMMWSVAKTVSNHGTVFLENLERYGTLSMTLSGIEFPAEAAGTYVDDDGNVAVLLGMTGDGIPATVEGPLGPIRLVNIKLLTAAETQFCVAGSTGVTDARGELAQRFADQGEALWSSITRPSVV